MCWSLIQRNVVFIISLVIYGYFLYNLDEWAAVGQTMRAHGQLMSSVSCASVPKYTVIIGNSIGLNNYMMVMYLIKYAYYYYY